MSSIWSWGRHSKVDCNSTLPWGSLIWHILTSLGRFDFWQGKWTPNWKISVLLESRLKEISNELSCTWFQHQEGLQKSPESRTTHQVGHATHPGCAMHQATFLSENLQVRYASRARYTSGEAYYALKFMPRTLPETHSNTSSHASNHSLLWGFKCQDCCRVFKHKCCQGFPISCVSHPLYSPIFSPIIPHKTLCYSLSNPNPSLLLQTYFPTLPHPKS